MPDQTNLAPARLIEVDLNDREPVPGGRAVDVQFNPETLKVTCGNTVAKTDTAGSAAMQFVATSSTKLDLELWFDTTVDRQGRSMRKLTEDIYYFITPTKGERAAKFKVPGVRFHWGDFKFDGVLISLNETLEMFSHDGRPLRSRITLSFAAQEIRFRIEGMDDAAGATGPGQTPQTPVKQGDSVQKLTGQSGGPAGWKAVAAANGIENPRLPEVGALLSPASVGAALGRVGRGR